MNITTIYPKLLMSNTYILENQNKAIIVDCGADLVDVKQKLTKPVCAILITHAHFDHIKNLESYEKEFNCPVYVSSFGVEKLSNKHLNLSEMFKQFSVEIHSLKNIVEIEKNSEIEISGFSIQTILTPGHSNCSVTYKIDNNLFVGDVVFHNGVGRSDLLTGNEEELERSVKLIAEFKGFSAFPGHGISFMIQ